MEIKTCEQYVLDQLEQAQAERDWLRGELEQAHDEAEELRAKLYRDGTDCRTSVSSGGELIPFEDWCIEHVGYSSLRRGMTKNEFIAYFEPEFREEYDELVNEWKAGQE